jgi:hypothetical protein
MRGGRRGGRRRRWARPIESAHPGRLSLPARACLGVVLADELRRLGRTLGKPGVLKDRGDIGVRGEVLPACLVPVKDGPNAVALIWIPKEMRPLATVLLSLLSALR